MIRFEEPKRVDQMALRRQIACLSQGFSSAGSLGSAKWG